MGKEVELLKFEDTAKGKEERAQFLEMFKAFELQEEHEPMMITLQGTEGTGKTHTYCQLAELGAPIYIADTELRARKVAQKKFGLTDIHHCSTWEEVVIWVTYVIKKKPKGWFVFDSVSDIVTYAERRVLAELDREKIGKGIYWGPVYEKVDKLFTMLKEAGFSIVCTARMKDEYMNEQRTGKLKPAVYPRVPYQSDLVIQLEKDGSRQIMKPLFGPVSDVKFTMDMSLAELVRMFD